MSSWIDDISGAVKLIIFIGVLALVYNFFIAPKEEVGYVSYNAFEACTVRIDTEPNSSSNFFKTFTCDDNPLNSGQNCYYMETENSVCTKGIHYYRDKVMTTQN